MAGLLNRAAVRRLILDRAGKLRPRLGLTRVSAESLEQLEAHLRLRIDGLIERHPSTGKTFKP